MSVFSMPPSEIIILSANNYDSEDISGCSVFYTFDTTMEVTSDDPNTIGNVPAKVWGPKELFKQIVCAPAKYVADFTMRMKKNVPTLYLSSVHYLNRVRLVDDIASFPETPYGPDGMDLATDAPSAGDPAQGAGGIPATDGPAAAGPAQGAGSPSTAGGAAAADPAPGAGRRKQHA